MLMSPFMNAFEYIKFLKMFKLCTRLSCVLYMFSQLFSFYKIGICVNIELKIDRMGAFFVCVCIEQGLKEDRTEDR